MQPEDAMSARLSARSGSGAAAGGQQRRPRRRCRLKSLAPLLVGAAIAIEAFLLTSSSRFPTVQAAGLVGRPPSLAPRTTSSNSQQQQAVGRRANLSSGPPFVGVARTRRAAPSQSGKRRPAPPPSAQSTVATPPSAQSPRQQQADAGDAALPGQAQQQQPPAPLLSAGRTIKNVTAQNGQSVLLHCFVEPNANGDVPSVSWFRGIGELQLLTYEQTTAVQDERFVVRHGLQRENDWALQIKNLDKATDSGLYQCQTTNGNESPVSQFYQLNIVEPQVSIVGAPDVSVKVGAPVSLDCLISHTADQMQFIFWYRNERMINYDIANDRRAKIVISKGAGDSANSTRAQAQAQPQLQLPQDSIISSLQIYSARSADSGNYTCQPSGAHSASVYLHVLEAQDRRLIMFQNDDQSSLAASSQHQQLQQSSSSAAAARHSSESRPFYGLFLALIVLGHWFNLIAQAQTCISLSLLAVIGLLLGRVADASSRAKSSADERRRSRHHEAAHLLQRSKSDSPTASAKKGDQSPSPYSPKHPPDETQERSASGEPLLERAHDAINLLRTLNSSCQLLGDEADASYSPILGASPSESHRTGSDDHASCCRQSTTNGSVSTKSPTAKNNSSSNNKPAQQPEAANKQQQASPSACSSASSSSTGYNSELSAAQHCCVARQRRQQQQRKLQRSSPSEHVELVELRLDGDGELASDCELTVADDDDQGHRPTALRLVLQQLDEQHASKLFDPNWTSFSLRRAPGGRFELQPVGSEAKQADELEQHYAQPASLSSTTRATTTSTSRAELGDDAQQQT